MRGSRSILNGLRSFSPVLAVILAQGCSTETTPQGPVEPEPASSGTLELTVEVTGTRPDADGYDVSISLATQAGPLVRPVEPGGGTLQISELPLGTHFLRVQGLAHPCRVVGSQPFAVTIEPGATTRLKVSVSCPGPGPAPAPSGTLELRVTGHDAVTLRGYRALMQISGEIEPRIRFSTPGSTTTISALPPGTHSLRVEPLAGNCLAGNAGGHPFTIVTGETTTIELVALCSAVYGSLAGSYEREILNDEPHFQSERYVLLADGSFRLRYQTSATHSFEYPGAFYQETGVTGTVLTLLFTGYVGRGGSARVVGDCLEVDYNGFMLLSDFAPGRFCRQ